MSWCNCWVTCPPVVCLALRQVEGAGHVKIVAGSAGSLQGQVHCSSPQPQPRRSLLAACTRALHAAMVTGLHLTRLAAFQRQLKVCSRQLNGSFCESCNFSRLNEMCIQRYAGLFPTACMQHGCPAMSSAIPWSASWSAQTALYHLKRFLRSEARKCWMSCF